ncbi:hypothetical protein GN956_G24392 [Arapaima gigas]
MQTHESIEPTVSLHLFLDLGFLCICFCSSSFRVLLPPWIPSSPGHQVTVSLSFFVVTVKFNGLQDTQSSLPPCIHCK